MSPIQSAQSIVDYVFSTYPSNEQQDIFEEFCRENSSNISTWHDFTEVLANFYTDTNMSVTKSSTWVVCQEFLGNLDETSLEYTQSRGGIWSFICEPPNFHCDIITVRTILTDIKEKYPILI